MVVFGSVQYTVADWNAPFTSWFVGSGQYTVADWNVPFTPWFLLQKGWYLCGESFVCNSWNNLQMFLLPTTTIMEEGLWIL